jgi:hypothetical protein
MTVATLADLKDYWPDDETGRRCRDLLLAYLHEKLLQTAAGNDCNPVSAQPESAADKVVAKLIIEFRTLGTTAAPVKNPTLPSLHRFKHEKPATPE